MLKTEKSKVEARITNFLHKHGYTKQDKEIWEIISEAYWSGYNSAIRSFQKQII